MASFKLPEPVLAKRTCWGPVKLPDEAVYSCLGTVATFPFAPSLKSERVSRVCDFTYWTAQRQLNAQRDHPKGGFFPGAGRDRAEEPRGSTDFQMVDSFKPQKPQRYRQSYQKRGAYRTMGQPGGWQPQGQQQGWQNRPAWGQTQGFQRGGMGGPGAAGRGAGQMGAMRGGMNQSQMSNRWNRQKFVVPELHLEIQDAWEVVQTVQLSQLSGYNLNANAVEAKDIAFRGQVRYYDAKNDRVTPKKPKDVDSRFHKELNFITSTVIADDILTASLEDESRHIDVIASDNVLAPLMVAPSSKYAWHIYITKLDNKLIFDKSRPGVNENSAVDFLTVSECSLDPPTIDDQMKINRVFDLGVEAVRINQDFCQLVLDTEKPVAKSAEAPPFYEPGQKNAIRGFKYREITLPASRVTANCSEHSVRRRPVKLFVRAEVDAVISPEAEAGASQSPNRFVSVKALNEGKVKGVESWRTQFDKQKGSLQVNEYRNNANKIGKWVSQAEIGGIEYLKLGFVVRNTSTDNTKHQVLGIQGYKVSEIASQLGIKTSNTWAIVREIIDILLNDVQDDGSFVLVRDSTHPQLRIFKLPEDNDEIVETDGEEDE